MKFLTKMLLLFSFIIAQAESIDYELSTDDIKNPSVLNSLGAVDILDLSGYYNIGRDIERFKIISLPDPSEGILYLEDGETEVQVGQILNTDEADNLQFDPNPNFVGDATFQYASVNSNDEVDPNPATVTIPVYAKVSTPSEDDNETSTPSEDDNETSTPSEDDNETSSPSGDDNGTSSTCSCDNYNSTPSLSLWGVVVMMILTLTFVREEFNEDF